MGGEDPEGDRERWEVIGRLIEAIWKAEDELRQFREEALGRPIVDRAPSLTSLPGGRASTITRLPGSDDDAS